MIVDLTGDTGDDKTTELSQLQPSTTCISKTAGSVGLGSSKAKPNSGSSSELRRTGKDLSDTMDPDQSALHMKREGYLPFMIKKEDDDMGSCTNIKTKEHGEDLSEIKTKSDNVDLPKIKIETSVDGISEVKIKSEDDDIPKVRINKEELGGSKNENQNRQTSETPLNRHGLSTFGRISSRYPCPDGRIDAIRRDKIEKHYNRLREARNDLDSPDNLSDDESSESAESARHAENAQDHGIYDLTTTPSNSQERDQHAIISRSSVSGHVPAKRNTIDLNTSPQKKRKTFSGYDNSRVGNHLGRNSRDLVAANSVERPQISSFRRRSDSVELSEAAVAHQKKGIENKLALIESGLPSDCNFNKAMCQFQELKSGLDVFGDGKIFARDGGWKTIAMKSPLKNYQVPAVAWMLRRERGKEEPFGGILADAMGIGKTIESLACVTANPPGADDLRDYCQATLIVVPSRVVAQQWQSEIKKHCAERIGKSVIIYSKRSRLVMKEYLSHWIVLTTYSEVGAGHISKGELRELREKYGNDVKAYKDDVKRRLGPLFDVAWYRIILDEAHAIKGVGGKISRACCDLNSKYYWALSGTPITNNVEELYPYLRFMGMDIAKDLNTFREEYVFGDRARDRLRLLMQEIMYRRAAKDTFLGRKILDIPRVSSQDVVVDLSKEEEVLIACIENYFEEEIDEIEERERRDDEDLESEKKIVRRGRLLRLRQVVSHTFNLEAFLRENVLPRHIQSMRLDLRSKASTGNISGQLERHGAFRGSLETFEELAVLRNKGGDIFGGKIDLMKILSMTENEIRVRKVPCLLCEGRTPPSGPRRNLNCSHIYCGKCLLGALKNAATGTSIQCKWEGCHQQLADGGNQVRLPTLHCMRKICLSEGRFFADPSSDANAAHPRLEPRRSGFFDATTQYAKEDTFTPPSTKLSATMAMILKWRKEHPSDKIIVFTQFIPTAKVLGKMLALAEISFLYYMGGISLKDRARNLKDFKHDELIKVLIVTLKCGAESLNLQVANRMILIDPWWNKPVEKQAFGRVVRHGQTKTSHLVRIITNSEIDQLLVQLQEDKAVMVDKALGDDSDTSSEDNVDVV